LELVLRRKLLPQRISRFLDLLNLPLNYYPHPLGFLIVGLAVLFLRLDDLNAWRVALLFAGFAASGPFFKAPFRHPCEGSLFSGK